jgi:PAS domain-containing protein
MRFRTFSLGMRHQLWGLFGLLLLAGATVLVIDEMLQSYTRTSLEQMRDNSLHRLRALKAVSDGTGWTCRYDLPRAQRFDDVGQGRGDDRCGAGKDRPQLGRLADDARSPEQQVLFEQVRGARVRARRDGHLARHPRAARHQGAGPFRRHRAVSGHRPVTTRMEALSNLAMLNSERMVREEIDAGGARASCASACRWSHCCWPDCCAPILRNVYKGVESLTQLARDMRKHQPDERLPAFRPRGELGDVMDAFVDMRRDVMRYESDLTGQLAVNEGVRAELERRGEFQRSLLNAAQVAILAMDGHGRWIMFNPFAEKLLGWEASDILGRVPRYGTEPQPDDSPMLVPPSEVERIVAALGRQRGAKVPPDWRAMYLLAELDRPPHEAVLVHRDGAWCRSCSRWPRSRMKSATPAADRGGDRPHRTQAPGRSAARKRSARAGSQSRQERVPRGDEPRDPHADGGRHRAWSRSSRTRNSTWTSGARSTSSSRRPNRCCRSSATSSISRRSKRGAWNCRPRPSTCAAWCA